MTDIEPVHRWAYRGGEDPIEWAAFLAALHIDARDEARAGQLAPGVPLTLLDLDDTSVGRRIVASLLDAGWTPPSDDTLRQLTEETDRICGHCKEPMRGYASAGATWLCHPDEGLDCYRMVTVYKHPMPCFPCASTHYDDPETP